MADESDSKTVAKLVLLQQACCDSRFKGGAHAGVLAVILDACHGKPRCFIGPTSIGRIAGLHERTVHGCIKDLVAAGYVKVEKRSLRSNWLTPNFGHAERSGCLVSYKDGKVERVHRPVKSPANPFAGTGPQTRYPLGNKPEIAGLQTPASGPAEQRQRVHRPDEAIKETIEEAVKAPLSLEEQEQQRLQKEEQGRLELEQRRTEYLQALSINPKHATFMRTHWPYLGDIVEEKAA